MDAFEGRLPLVLAAAGVLSHLLVFIRIKPIFYSPQLLVAASTAPVVLAGALRYLIGVSCLDAVITATLWCGSWLSGLLVSMLIYRVFFHRLRHYPGPFMARVTQWYHVWNVRERIDNFRHLDSLHKQYGDFVRVGPNMLSIVDPNIVNVVHAQTTKFHKAEWYEGSRPLTSLHQITDHALHDKRRRHGWDKAFTASALRSYDSRITKYTNQLIQQLRRRSGQVVNIQEWIGFFAFDVMGDLAFGRSFDALDKGTSHQFTDLIRGNGFSMGLLSTVPWIIPILMRLPIPPSKNPVVRLLSMSNELVADRKKQKPEAPDVMSHILEAGEFFEDKKTEDDLLTGDARLLVVAGSDTTAATLTYVMYHLANDLTVADKLRAEFAEHKLRADDDSLTIVAMAHLPYLNAVINETLRLYPPVPGGVYRESPEGGITFDGHFIPGGCVVLSPQWTIQRSPKAFAQPDEFVPERWTTRPDMIIDRSAFFPFLLGRYGCIGKQLAYNEMRSVVSRLVMEFDIAFGKGEDGSRLLYETQDHFTLGLAGLDVVFTPRQ